MKIIYTIIREWQLSGQSCEAIKSFLDYEKAKLYMQEISKHISDPDVYWETYKIESSELEE